MSHWIFHAKFDLCTPLLTVWVMCRNAAEGVTLCQQPGGEQRIKRLHSLRSVDPHGRHPGGAGYL
jgi:hypothetical protein